MRENDIAREVVDASYRIHTTLGPGLLESVYEETLAHELDQVGLKYSRQKGFPVEYNSVTMELGFRADLIIENKVIIEIKSIDVIAPVHKKQLLTYLRLTGLKLGLLINFNEALIKHGITRLVNNL